MVRPSGGEMNEEEIEGPPTNEQEEIERRTRIPLLTIIRWYIRHNKPLDVPLRDYVPRGEHNGEST
jgi:hypothetical protein